MDCRSAKAGAPETWDQGWPYNSIHQYDCKLAYTDEDPTTNKYSQVSSYVVKGEMILVSILLPKNFFSFLLTFETIEKGIGRLLHVFFGYTRSCIKFTLNYQDKSSIGLIIKRHNYCLIPSVPIPCTAT